MSRDTARGSISDLKPGTPVLVAGGGVTGRSVLTALAPLGVTATLCDDDPSTRQQFADAGTATVDSLTAAQRRGDHHRLRAGRDKSGLCAPTASGAGRCRRVVGHTDLGRSPSWPGGWTIVRPLRAAATLAGGDRHQRQDDHHVDAARDAGRRRQARQAAAATSASPVLDVLDASPADLLVVELSSFQLHWAPSVSPEAGVVLNIAEDHLDWHATLADYAADKARVLTGRVAVAGLDDPVAAVALLASEPALAAGRASGSANPPSGSSACATACSSTTPSKPAPPPFRRFSAGGRLVDPGCRGRWALLDALAGGRAAGARRRGGCGRPIADATGRRFWVG